MSTSAPKKLNHLQLPWDFIYYNTQFCNVALKTFSNFKQAKKQTNQQIQTDQCGNGCMERMIV